MEFAMTLCFRPQRGGSGLPSQSRFMLSLTRKHKRTEGENREVQGRSASPDVPSLCLGTRRNHRYFGGNTCAKCGREKPLHCRKPEPKRLSVEEKFYKRMCKIMKEQNA